MSDSSGSVDSTSYENVYRAANVSFGTPRYVVECLQSVLGTAPGYNGAFTAFVVSLLVSDGVLGMRAISRALVEWVNRVDWKTVLTDKKPAGMSVTSAEVVCLPGAHGGFSIEATAPVKRINDDWFEMRIFNLRVIEKLFRRSLNDVEPKRDGR